METMEDDIDIEEHDLLDNPRIRDIFPDLGIVKEEPQELYSDQGMVLTVVSYRIYSDLTWADVMGSGLKTIPKQLKTSFCLFRTFNFI